MKYLLILLLLSGCTFSPSLEDSEKSVEVVTPESKPIKQNLKIKAIDLKKGKVLFLNSEVGDESHHLIKDLADANKANTPVYLLIDSPGGSVLEGAALITAMEASRVPVYTICTSLCASMAAFILAYGTKRYMIDRSILMMHPASVTIGEHGEVDKIVSRLVFLKRYVDKLDFFVANRAGMTYQALKARTSQELWLDAEDAYADGFIDSVVKIDYEQLVSKPSPDNLRKESINLNLE